MYNKNENFKFGRGKGNSGFSQKKMTEIILTLLVNWRKF